MNIQLRSVLASVLGGIALSGAHFAHGHDQHSRQAVTHAARPAAVIEAVAKAPLAARYALEANGRRTEWFLWREVNTVETANVATGESRIWERLRPGEFRYRRVFKNDRTVVEYVPGEVRVRNAEPDWSKLESVVSPQLLQRLKRSHAGKAFGEPAERYTGRVDDRSIDIVWLASSRLPAELKIDGPGKETMRLTLKALHVRAPAAWPRVSAEGISGYRLIDAADLGDLERDPFVARLAAMDDHHHGGHRH